MLAIIVLTLGFMHLRDMEVAYNYINALLVLTQATAQPEGEKARARPRSCPRWNSDRRRYARAPSVPPRARTQGKKKRKPCCYSRLESFSPCTVIKEREVSQLCWHGEQAGNGVASETEKSAQREGLRAFGNAELAEGGEASVPELLELGEDAGRVCFRVGGGAPGRRSARSVLSSMSHSTVSPRENSMA